VVLVLSAVLFFLSSYPALSRAETLSFIEKVRVGLHRDTVRIVLIMDHKPSGPEIDSTVPARPVITMSGVMPGANVHRSLVVRKASFRKYLSSLHIVYLPDRRETRLSATFTRPVSPPTTFTLSHPDRLVLDFKIAGANGKSAERENPANSARTATKPSHPHKLVIPGKNLPEASPPQSAPSRTISPEDGDRPHAVSAVLHVRDRKFRIILDAGHGGKDCGTQSVDGVCEKTLVLDIVKRLRVLLSRNPHFEVILTRTDDRFIPLDLRTRIANESHGDLFLSVHANADPDRHVRGIETFLLNLRSSDSRAQRIAQRENSALGVSHGDLSAILLTLKINHKKKRSWELAQQIEGNLSHKLRARYPEVRDLGVRQAPFYVIMGTTMPAVLAEVNFLSNRPDARLMESSRFREQTAVGLYQGIIAYFENVHPETHFHGITAGIVRRDSPASDE
jgi:N-acetylmuramoyl-L-alanine amidase